MRFLLKISRNTLAAVLKFVDIYQIYNVSHQTLCIYTSRYVERPGFAFME